MCLKNLKDFQLAIALAMVGEQGDDGPIVKEILTSTVIPTAFKEGNRWLASWAFWMLHRRDLAVRILIVRVRRGVLSERRCSILSFADSFERYRQCMGRHHRDRTVSIRRSKSSTAILPTQAEDFTDSEGDERNLWSHGIQLCAPDGEGIL